MSGFQFMWRSMMKHTDSSYFINKSLMIRELKATGSIMLYADMSEAELIYQYNLQFLANTYEHQNESKNYRPRGVRGDNGKFPT